MYHSITFGDKNTWDNWCLIPETEPIVAPPAPKTNYIDIPGASGSLDMSEAITGYPLYQNRTGSFSFLVMNDKAVTMPECNPIKLRNLVSNIMEYLHGKKMQMILEDDRSYFYRGRFTVDSIDGGEGFSKISIGYNLEPYKWSVYGVTDNWIWDTFNFQTGIITSELSNMDVTTVEQSITLQSSTIGKAPVCPEFRATSTDGLGVHIRFVNPTLGIDVETMIPNGTMTNPDLVMYGDSVTIYYRVASGTGKLTIDFRQGRL